MAAFIIAGIVAVGVMLLLEWAGLIGRNPGIFLLVLMATIIVVGSTNKFIVEAIERHKARKSLTRA